MSLKVTNVRRYIKKNKSAVILWSLFSDCLARLKQMSGNYSSDFGDTHRTFSVTESINYIDGVFNDYLLYGGLAPEDIRDKTVLELGPGDNFGVALKFLAQGARRVVCLDRFYCRRDFDQQVKIYHELIRRLRAEEKDRIQDAVRFSVEKRTIELDERRLSYVYGAGIEDAPSKLGRAAFDLIVSRSVLEHVFDTDQAFRSMDTLLRPRGIMVHKIDFRDHGMFSQGGHHPLTFLTLREGLYRHMSVYSGRPNRKLIDTYQRLVMQYSYEATFWMTHVLGGTSELIPHKNIAGVDHPYNLEALNLVRGIRPKLAAPYRDLSDRDLAITGIFLRAQKSKFIYLTDPPAIS